MAGGLHIKFNNRPCQLHEIITGYETCSDRFLPDLDEVNVRQVKLKNSWGRFNNDIKTVVEQKESLDWQKRQKILTLRYLVSQQYREFCEEYEI